MSRVFKLFLLMSLVLFVLACNVVTQPISDAQEAVATVQSLATALPLETLQSFATALPVETMQAIPSAMPDFGNIADPQDEPLSEWNDIPVMPAATAGEESAGIYSYKADASVSDALEYYKAEMTARGWTEFFSMPDMGGGSLLSYQKDNSLVTITITASGDGVLVLLTFQ